MGRVIRKLSIDELPQLFNVLKGEMSLVGPRPPIPYEVEKYKSWHLRRILEVKPGITGLWQVEGRSKTSFDDMVRLDIRYLQTWSIWLDLKILFRTVREVLFPRGDYRTRGIGQREAIRRGKMEERRRKKKTNHRERRSSVNPLFLALEISAKKVVRCGSMAWFSGESG